MTPCIDFQFRPRFWREVYHGGINLRLAKAGTTCCGIHQFCLTPGCLNMKASWNMKRSENPYNKNLCVDMCRQIYNIVYILIYRCTCTYLHRTITLIHPDVCSLLTMFFRTSGASLITVGYSGHVLFEGKRELKSTSGLWILDLLIYNFSMSVHLQKINFANGS